MKHYNIRVYALIRHQGKILLTDEFRANMRMTKFPGGGHEWGEGIEDCIRRECLEEMGQEPVHVEHFYTTGFFIASAFNPDDQLISIYYHVELPEPEKIPATDIPFAFEREENGAQIFRWIGLDEIHPEQLTFPVDKLVAEMIRG